MEFEDNNNVPKNIYSCILIRIFFTLISKMVDKNILIQELVNKQRKNIDILNKLSFREFLRIVKNIDSSLFCKENCCVWKGYHITKNNKKYINFFFHQKKKLLKRLLYINYIDKLENNEYIKTTCTLCVILII